MPIGVISIKIHKFVHYFWNIVSLHWNSQWIGEEIKPKRTISVRPFHFHTTNHWHLTHGFFHSPLKHCSTLNWKIGGRDSIVIKRDSSIWNSAFLNRFLLLLLIFIFFTQCHLKQKMMTINKTENKRKQQKEK